MQHITLFSLPPEKVRVKLKKEFRIRLVKELIKKFNSLSAIARALELPKCDYVRRYLVTERSGIPLSVLINISNITGITENTIQKNLIELKSIKSKEKIKNPNFPIKILTPEFGLVIGGVLGDGGIEKNKLRVWYFNQEIQQIESFINAMIKSVGKAGFAFHRSIGNVPCVIFPKITGIILETAGLISGNKNYSDIGIPSAFLEKNNKPARVLLSRLFDDDGTVCNHHHCRAVNLTSPKIISRNSKPLTPRVLLDVTTILELNGIKSKIFINGIKEKENGERTVYWLLNITGKQNLQGFYNKIGFGLERKQEKLKQALGRYVPGLEFFPRFHATESYLAKIKELYQKNVIVTAKSLAKLCKRNDRHVREILRKLTEQGLLERKKTGNYFVYLPAGGD